MEQGIMAFTAVFLKSAHGYVGFVEELPGVTTEGRTIEEARANLGKQAALVFDEERAAVAEMLEGKDVVRESFCVPVRQA